MDPSWSVLAVPLWSVMVLPFEKTPPVSDGQRLRH
jgi:hypothetical protein